MIDPTETLSSDPTLTTGPADRRARSSSGPCKLVVESFHRGPACSQHAPTACPQHAPPCSQRAPARPQHVPACSQHVPSTPPACSEHAPARQEHAPPCFQHAPACWGHLEHAGMYTNLFTFKHIRSVLGRARPPLTRPRSRGMAKSRACLFCESPFSVILGHPGGSCAPKITESGDSQNGQFWTLCVMSGHRHRCAVLRV